MVLAPRGKLQKRFNPRPPLLAGESPGADRAGGGYRVSIHARHCWRANPSGIQPRVASTEFQSTPAIAGGRITLETLAAVTGCCFNPRPPLLAGESDASFNGDTISVVSIHARHCWRANPGLIAAAELEASFQSTPAIAGGRILGKPGPRLLDEGVSIHARHCWRANLPLAVHPAAVVVFQSTPAIAGGRIVDDGRAEAMKGMFQSTPAIAGGRIREPHEPAGMFRAVSIHARHCWRANRFGGPVFSQVWLFQSTPAIAGGRILRRWASRGGRAKFQSTPAIAGGRIAGIIQPRSHCSGVSIHARHCWRANLFARNPLWLLTFFNHFRVPACTAS